MSQPNPNNPYINSFNTRDTQNNTQYGIPSSQSQNNPYTTTGFLGNENAQKAIFKGFAKVSSLFESGIEELKERYEDAKAEVNDVELNTPEH